MRIRPCKALRNRVASIEVLGSDDGTALVLPSTSVVFGVQLRGRVRAAAELLSPAGVTGIQQTAREYNYIGPTTSLLVRFSPQGASCFGVPVSELADSSVALEDLLPPARARDLIDRLLHAPLPHASVEAVEALLLELPFEIDPLVDRALHLLDSQPSVLVSTLARELQTSERTLERRFLARVGVTPKRYASLRRFERVLELSRSLPSWTDAALQAGYYDQSHFIRDFRRFAGAPPGHFRRGER